MRKRTLLVAGLIALGVSLIGPAVQAAITGEVGWRGHMSGYGHMGWWGEDQATGDTVEGAPETEVAATEFAFSPDEPTVMVGEAVNLTLVNAGDLPHDLVIPDLGVRLAAGPGRRATTGIEIDEAGSYRFLCSYPGHAQEGMTGVLAVNPNP